MKIKQIESRRSIRNFSDKKISNEALTNILTSALFTPTSMHLQPFHIIAVEKDAFDETKLFEMVKGQHSVLHAQYMLFIFTMKPKNIPLELFVEKLSFNKQKNSKEILEMAKKIKEVYISSSNDISGSGFAVAQTMSLEAEANGISGVQIGGISKPAISKYLSDKIDVKLYAPELVLALGHKAKDATIFNHHMATINEKVTFINKSKKKF